MAIGKSLDAPNVRIVLHGTLQLAVCLQCGCELSREIYDGMPQDELRQWGIDFLRAHKHPELIDDHGWPDIIEYENKHS